MHYEDPYIYWIIPEKLNSSQIMCQIIMLKSLTREDIFNDSLRIYFFDSSFGKEKYAKVITFYCLTNLSKPLIFHINKLIIRKFIKVTDINLRGGRSNCTLGMVLSSGTFFNLTFWTIAATLDAACQCFIGESFMTRITTSISW